MKYLLRTSFIQGKSKFQYTHQIEGSPTSLSAHSCKTWKYPFLINKDISSQSQLFACFSFSRIEKN